MSTSLLFCQWRYSNGWFSSLLWYTTFNCLTTSAFRHGTSNYYDWETELCIISGDDEGDMWKWKFEPYNSAAGCPIYCDHVTLTQDVSFHCAGAICSFITLTRNCHLSCELSFSHNYRRQWAENICGSKVTSTTTVLDKFLYWILIFYLYPHAAAPLEYQKSLGFKIGWLVIYNKPTRCNSGSIVFINNYKYALHVSDALCVHHQEHYKL